MQSEQWENLVNELMELSANKLMCIELNHLYDIVDFILSDRRRIVEPLVKALSDMIDLVQMCEYDNESIRESNYKEAIEILRLAEGQKGKE